MRIVSTKDVTRSGFFYNLKLNKGDCIHAVDGVPIRSIGDVRRAFREAVSQNHSMITILMYNVFRRLKTAVMCAVMTHMCPTHTHTAAEQTRSPMNIEDMYDVHEKVRLAIILLLYELCM